VVIKISEEDAMSIYQRDLAEALLASMREQAATHENEMHDCLNRHLDAFPDHFSERQRAELYLAVMNLVNTSIAHRNFSTNLMKIELALAILALIGRGEHLDHVDSG
jgi:hypothetical protein